MKITVFSKPNCGACDITKQWLDNNNAYNKYQEVVDSARDMEEK